MFCFTCSYNTHILAVVLVFDVTVGPYVDHRVERQGRIELHI